MCSKCRQTGQVVAACRTKKCHVSEGDKVNLLEGHYEYALSVYGTDQFEKIQMSIGGQKVQMIGDSGASMNIIDWQLWEKLKEKEIKCSSQKS